MLTRFVAMSRMKIIKVFNLEFNLIIILEYLDKANIEGRCPIKTLYFRS